MSDSEMLRLLIERKTQGTDDPVCPHCFSLYVDWEECGEDEYDNTYDHECGCCGRMYQVTAESVITFFTKLKE